MGCVASRQSSRGAFPFRWNLGDALLRVNIDLANQACPPGLADHGADPSLAGKSHNRRFRSTAFTIDKPLLRTHRQPENCPPEVRDAPTDRATPQRAESGPSLRDLLRMPPEAEEIDFDLAPVQIQLRPFDLD